jgi:MYXO-CTERM domain-containing protein
VEREVGIRKNRKQRETSGGKEAMPAIWRSINRFNSSSAVAIAAVAVIAPLASADNGENGPPGFLMVWDASNDQEGQFPYDPADFGSVAFGSWTLGGGAGGQGGPLRERTGWRYQGSLTNLAWSLTWDCVANADPFVDATINVVNNSASEQTFFVFMPLMISPPIGPNSFMSGYVSAVLTDADFSGDALLRATATEPVFQGSIDGNPLASARLWNPGYSLTASFNSANDDDAFNNTLGPSANTQIGITLRFVLSPFDSASVTGIFDVQPVPGPGALALLTLAGVVCRRRRRE